MLEHERWDRVPSATCSGLPRQLKREQRKLVRPVVLVAEADPSVALMIVMPTVPRVDRERHVEKRDLVKFGYTNKC